MLLKLATYIHHQIIFQCIHFKIRMQLSIFFENMETKNFCISFQSVLFAKNHLLVPSLCHKELSLREMPFKQPIFAWT